MNVLLINPDQGDHIGWFPQGLAAVAAAFEANGDHVRVVDLNATKFGIWSNPWVVPDIVVYSSCGGYWQYKKWKEFIREFRTSYRDRGVELWVGGHMFTSHPEYWKEKYPEITRIGMVDAEAELLGCKDLSDYPWPAYSLFDISHYRLMRMPRIGKDEYCLPILSSRGCPFKCSFCYRHEKRIRYRDMDDVVSEIKYLQRTYNISYFAFADELLMGSRDRAMEVAERLMCLHIKWDCNGRLNYAEPEVLHAMRKSGCVFINYGIESFNNIVLRGMNKALTCEQIEQGVAYTLEAGISPGLNIIYGFPEDTPYTMKRNVDFLLKYDDHAQLRTIRPVTPYPGSPLFDQFNLDIEEFYEKQHLNSDLVAVNMTQMSDDELYTELYGANLALLTQHNIKNAQRYEQQLTKLYVDRDTNFRGWRSK